MKNLFPSLRRLAAKVDNLLDSKASSAANDAQIDAKQRNAFDITKSNDAGASDGLGNVGRVSPAGETGVSQVPAIAAPGTGGVIACELPRAALQGGVASQPQGEAASSPATGVDGDARQRLIVVVKAARQHLEQHKKVLASTQENYVRKKVVLQEQWRQLQEQMHNGQLSVAQIAPVLLGKYATSPNSFYAMRRAQHFCMEELLLESLKAQDKLQKLWTKSPLEAQKSRLLLAMDAAADQLERITKGIEFIQSFSLKVCQEAYGLHFCGPMPKNSSAQTASTKKLVTALTRKNANWQDAFRVANAQSRSPYRAHAWVQSLLGIRPSEFDPAPNPRVDEAVPLPNRPGVAASLLDNGNVNVTVLGAKLGEHSGQEVRSMEIIASAVPSWFAAQLQQAGGSMHLSAKTQALRDHYKRVSAKAFKGQIFGRDKNPLHATPYCFRHAVTTQLRESDWAVEEIAAFLGQQSGDTPQHYGQRKGGKRKSAPQSVVVVRSSVQASKPVKAQKSLWRDKQLKVKPQAGTRRNLAPK
jgi:hypothetical protein